MSDVHDMAYYQKCMVGGILSCGITHTIVCPLDIVKCRMQVSNLVFPFLSISFSLFESLSSNATLCLTKYFLSFNRQTQVCTRVLEMDLSKLKLNKVWEDLLSDGFQLLQDTLHKVSENSVFTRSLRMFIEMLLVRMSQNTELQVLPFHLLVPRSSLMSYSAHGKP